MSVRMLHCGIMRCLHDPANAQQTSSKCIQYTRANAGRLLDRVNTLLGLSLCQNNANYRPSIVKSLLSAAKGI